MFGGLLAFTIEDIYNTRINHFSSSWKKESEHPLNSMTTTLIYLHKELIYWSELRCLFKLHTSDNKEKNISLNKWKNILIYNKKIFF